MTYSDEEAGFFRLTCDQGSCKFTGYFHRENQTKAFAEGWRMEDEKHICPSCMGKRNAKQDRILRSKITIAITTPMDDNAFTEQTAKMFEKLDATIKEFFPMSEIFGKWEEDG